MISVSSFTKNILTESVINQGEQSDIVFDYYLSDNFETIFDEAKIGKIKNGKYIIVRNDFSKIFIYEIIEISDAFFKYVIINPEAPERPKKIAVYKAVTKDN